MSLQKIDGIILAAGFGTRLKPLTDSVPKAIVEVCGQPLIFYALENMKKAKVSRVVINTHYLSQLVVEKVKSVNWPFEVMFSHEPQILGTGGGIKRALEYLPQAGAVLVQNADALIENDVCKLLEQHSLSGSLSTMLLKTIENPDEYGAVVTDSNDRVRDIVGLAGYQGQIGKRRMFNGMQVLDPSIRNWMPKREEFCILRDVLIPAIKEDALVTASENQGFFCDVGTLDRLQFANHYFSRPGREKTSFGSI